MPIVLDPSDLNRRPPAIDTGIYAGATGICYIPAIDAFNVYDVTYCFTLSHDELIPFLIDQSRDRGKWFREFFGKPHWCDLLAQQTREATARREALYHARQLPGFHGNPLPGKAATAIAEANAHINLEDLGL